jgi:small GTP-binding protein
MNKKLVLRTKVLFVGADSVGKTTLLYLLKLKEKVLCIPTIGFNVEDIDYKNKKIEIFDVGGGDKIRFLWKNYIPVIKCIVYIINISDKERLDYFVETFNILLEQQKDYRNIPIIIFGNIFDDKIEFEPKEMLNKINIPPEISPYIIKGNITKEEGLSELLDYINNNIEFIEVPIEEKEEKEENNENNENNENKEIVKKETKRVLMLGLDDSGKTKILYLLKLKEKVTTIPTIGFNVEDINKESWEKAISIWDVGGNVKIRCLWLYYFENLNGIIWVYDISNKERIEESQNELKKMLDNSKIEKNIPLLIYANKCDLNINGNKTNDFLTGIQDYINSRPYYIKECNINDLESYEDGLDWLYMNLK